MDWRKCTIKELEDLLFASSGTEIDEAMLEALDNDERSGVQKLLARYRTMVYEEKARRMRWEKMNEFSRKIYARGYRHIVGVDEAGRGRWLARWWQQRLFWTRKSPFMAWMTPRN